MPEELREFLFTKGNLKNITNEKFTKLVDKCRKHGIDSVQEDIEVLNRESLIYHQIGYSIDVYENMLRMLISQKEKIERGPGVTNFKRSDYEFNIMGYEPEAKEVNLKLYEVLATSIETMGKALNDACTIRNEFQDKVMN